MASAVSLRGDYSATELRGLASATKNANQSRRLLSLAAVLDGMNRTEAARMGGMDRQTLRDWVHRFNDHGPEGLLDSWSKGPAPRLSAEQRAEIGQLVETGPDRAVHGVVRWRRIDLQRVIVERFGIAYHERTVGKLLQDVGLLAHQWPSASPGSGRAHDRGVQKNFPATLRAHLTGRARENPSRSGSRTRRGSARRMASCGNGQNAERARASPLISATRARTCSARSVRLEAQARRWPCRSPTPRQCSFTSTRSPAP